MHILRSVVLFLVIQSLSKNFWHFFLFNGFFLSFQLCISYISSVSSTKYTHLLLILLLFHQNALCLIRNSYIYIYYDSYLFGYYNFQFHYSWLLNKNSLPLFYFLVTFLQPRWILFALFFIQEKKNIIFIVVVSHKRTDTQTHTIIITLKS